MTVRARLDGHQFDLDALVELFPVGDPCVVRDDEGVHFLVCSELDSYLTAGDGRLFDVAEVVLGRLNAAARLDDANFRPVAVVGTFDRPNGEGGTDISINITDSINVRDRVTVVRASTAEARARVYAVAVAIGPDGEIVKPVPRGPRYLRLAEEHLDVAELLNVLGTSDMSWDDLYKAFEIVRDSSKHGKRPQWSLEQLGYLKDDVSNFTGSVNLHRHTRPSGLPKRELALAECQQFVREMAERWFQMLEAGSNGEDAGDAV